VFEPCAFPDHALLDSGDGQKLERFGRIVLARPDPQALWRRRLGAREWERADLVFVRESERGGRWEPAGGRPPADGWPLAFDGARFWVRPTPFKHVGVFPEQAPNWRWMEARLRAAGPDARVLHLFAYTGVASLLARATGARVTHVDASRLALAWARRNSELSGLEGEGLRWVLDDALGFARREARRSATYTGILLDPPHHGRGPKGERWRLEADLPSLLEACARLLAAKSFMILSSYAVGYSALSLYNLLAGMDVPGPGKGEVEAGELVLPEEGGDRLLPCGFAARWSRGL
jgi:23S rRNA (cytosine1962-C5)-methyltransferase